jgi:hypothetical protein
VKFSSTVSLLLEIVGTLLYPPFVSILPALRTQGKVQVQLVNRLSSGLILLLLMVAPVLGQEKGVDPQNTRIRESGTNRQPANNGRKQDEGTGRGIDFGKGKTPPTVFLPNPYRLAARKDAIVKAVQNLMEERKMVVDSSASRPADGVIISQPYTFIRGAVVAQSEISRYADLPPMGSRGWTRGRYTLIIEVQPIDGANTNVSVTAKVEARSDGASGAEWTSLRSNGTAEQEFLSALIENVTGTSPTQQPRP